MGLPLGGALERLPGLDLAAGDVEAVHTGKAVILGPDLAVDVRSLRAHHIDLRGVDIALGRQRPELELLASRIELDDRGLVHVAEPQIARAIGAQAKAAGRKLLSVFGIGKFSDLAGFGIEPAEILLAETGKPDYAVLVHHYIMWRDFLARQIVFRVDHPRRPALW